MTRTSARIKAKELAKYLRSEQPDYPYLKSVFRELRKELEIAVPRASTRLPEVPTEEEMRAFYREVWQARKFADMVLIKTLFYTGVRVSELVTGSQHFSPPFSPLRMGRGDFASFSPR
jgi:integrase/recombinase XerD